MRNIIITGSNGQLGRAFVSHFLAKGDKVYSVDLFNDSQIDHPNHCFQKLDITNETQVESYFKSFSQIDVVINNAGIGKFTPFEERSASDFLEVCNVNMLGTFLFCREAIKLMKAQLHGKIINIGSIYGVVSSDPRIYGVSGRNNSEVYSMTKAAVIMFSKYLAANYGAFNIQVNTISPGGIKRAQSEDFVENYVNKTPAGRMGTPDDLIPTLEMLTSTSNSYINGQNIIVDGGFSIW